MSPYFKVQDHNKTFGAFLVYQLLSPIKLISMFMCLREY